MKGKSWLMTILAGLMVLTGVFGSAQGEAAAGKWPSKLVFGYLPDEAAAGEDMKKGRELLMKDMSAFLKVPVEVVICDDYNAIIETMRNRKLHLANFGPLSYIIAHSRSKAEPVCVMAKDLEHAFYYSYLVTGAKSPVKTLKDIRGKRMSFVDPASTSGNLIPRALIVNNFKVKPEEIDTKFFASVQFAGSHTNSLLAAANYSVDVAAVASEEYARAIENGLVKQEDVQILTKSDPIPNSPIAVYGGLPADLKAKIKAFFLTYTNEEFFKMRKSPGKRYIEVKDANYDGLRQTAKAMKLSPEALLKK